VIEAAGGEVLELAAEERQAFIRAVKPLHDEARKQFGDEVFALVPAA
jgi:TRAP-type C4-dicarboxylate transport system substrate-binding protein